MASITHDGRTSITAPAPDWSTGQAQADSDLAEELLGQFQVLGMNRSDALRLLHAARAALGEVLAGLDRHALAAVPIEAQVSMLLPRFDVERLARHCGLGTAQVQSALAILVLGFVTHPPRAHH